MAVDTKQVSGLANQRPEDADYGERQVKELGSRVTTKQTQIVLDTVTRGQREKLAGDDEKVVALRAYADTGDRSQLSGEQSEVLKALVNACRERIEAESQKRRVWPRKVAAIVVGEVDARATS